MAAGIQFTRLYPHRDSATARLIMRPNVRARKLSNMFSAGWVSVLVRLSPRPSIGRAWIIRLVKFGDEVDQP
jgi:hypothetical protein